MIYILKKKQVITEVYIMVSGKYEYFSSLGSMNLEARKQRDNEEDEKIKLRCGDIITKIKLNYHYLILGPEKHIFIKLLKAC